MDDQDPTNWDNVVVENDVYKQKRITFVTPSDKQILAKWYEFIPIYKHETQRVEQVAIELDIKPMRVRRLVREMKLKEEANRIKKEVNVEIYKDKIPLAKRIIGLSLHKLHDYLEKLRPEEITDLKEAKNLESIATNLNNLLRLELGQSTQNLAVQAHYTFEQAEDILRKVKEKDKIFGFNALPEIDEKLILTGSEHIGDTSRCDEQDL